MLTEMAAMSLDDGLVMQIHPGCVPQPQPLAVHGAYGRDKGADIPQRTDYVRALKPLLDRFGNEPRADASSSSRSTRAPTAASSRRSPAIIRR